MTLRQHKGPTLDPWDHPYPGPRPKRGHRCASCGRRIWRFIVPVVFGVSYAPAEHRYCGQPAAYKAIPPNRVLNDPVALERHGCRRAGIPN